MKLYSIDLMWGIEFENDFYNLKIVFKFDWKL